MYLENNLASNSFTKDRVDILWLLSSEIAVAIENATLYTDLKRAMIELEDYKNTLERKVDGRTIELRKKNEELEQLLQKLHQAQKQIVQQEKLVALGFFSQGVAHEIQNPLNFVNNFSDLIIDHVENTFQELSKTKQGLTDVPRIEDDLHNIHLYIKKIKENGTRIKNIIHLLLRHGKMQRGELSLVNVHDSLHEASDAAYRDLLLKNSLFEVAVDEYFDESVGEIEGIPEDLFRAFLNLIHNAFYAAYEKKQAVNADFAPSVAITTRQSHDQVEIRIRDNGQGIPEDKYDDVMIAFYTTKPPGTGMGLGLSLSYDIFVQEHGGKLAINSSTIEEDSFTEIIVTLPQRP